METGSEVLVPSFGCLGTVTPVLQAGLEPVFVDVDEDFNIRFESVKQACGPKTRAVIVPHLSGLWAADTERIVQFARQNNLWIIEDAAQAQGLVHQGVAAGTFGDIGIFSAHGGKQILSAAGGWVVTRNQQIGDRLRARELGQEPRDIVQERMSQFMELCAAPPAQLARKYLGRAVQYRTGELTEPVLGDSVMQFTPAAMSGLDARLILLQLEKLDEIRRLRIEHAQRWISGLARLPFTTMRIPPVTGNIFTKLLLSFRGPGGEMESDFFRRTLLSCGIETEWSYMPLHLRPPLDKHRRASMDCMESGYRGAFAVPVRPNLGRGDWKRIAKALSAASGYST